jgi:hypothetical protein
MMMLDNIIPQHDRSKLVRSKNMFFVLFLENTRNASFESERFICKESHLEMQRVIQSSEFFWDQLCQVCIDVVYPSLFLFFCQT